MTDKKYAVVPWEVLERALSIAERYIPSSEHPDWETAVALRAIIDKGPAEPACYFYTWADHSTDTTYGYRQGQKPVSSEPLFRAPEDQA